MKLITANTDLWLSVLLVVCAWHQYSNISVTSWIHTYLQAYNGCKFGV